MIISSSHRLIHSQLKLKTRQEHERLERSLDLLRPDLRLEQYVELLKGFYGFYRPWEDSVADSLNDIAPDFFPGRSKVPLLVQDLRHFGVDVGTVSDCPTLPGMPTISEILGCMYVLEGSTLGGQLLSAHFSRTLGVSPGAGGSYFSGYGKETGSKWKSFLEVLESRSTEENQEQIIQSALQTFRILHVWLVKDYHA